MNYADTGFIVSLYLEETTSGVASALVAQMKEPLALTALSQLELRNAFNRAVNRGRITLAQRDAYGAAVEDALESGRYVVVPIPSAALHAKARELSDPLHADSRDAQPRPVARRRGGSARRKGVLLLR